MISGCLAVIGGVLAARERAPLLHARAAESGGWNPDVLTAQAGQPMQLRLTSDDVMHGFGVGGMEMGEVDIQPGRVTEVTLTFDRPGTYTFYCTRWCGINHWRMRGTIEVGGPDEDSVTSGPPLYVQLGLDLDAPHPAEVMPAARPSAPNGRQLAGGLDISPFMDTGYYRAHSPARTFLDLAGGPSLSEAERWDLVAFVWSLNTTPERISNGARLYARNCAACHGEAGGGDGVFADDLSVAGGDPGEAMTLQAPARLSDPRRMLGASPALLQGKILRGGMGTGMPMWGVIFTEEETWDLVAYLYSLQFTTATP